MLSYKRIDLAIAGCALAGVPLHIVGTGPAERSLRTLAEGTRTTFHGHLDDGEVNRLVGDARAALVCGVEDFGLVPLEAAAAGRPTIAFASGGALETVIEGETGAFFHEPTAVSLATALHGFDAASYEPERLRRHAEHYSPPRFIERLRRVVDGALEQRENRIGRFLR